MRTMPDRRVGLFVVIALALGCGGGGETVGPPDPEPVATVTVALSASSIAVGQTSQGAVTLRDAGGNPLTGRDIAWSSSNNSVASVSSGGLVTGVTPGTANIIATSEGKTGQASITITAPPLTEPQVTGLTVGQGGQAVNLSQVAGTIDFSFTMDIPSGYSGTLTLTIDSVEFHRETVSAPAISANSAGGVIAEPIVVTSQRSISAETSRTSFSVTQVRIDELPLLSNKSYEAILKIIPTVPGGPSEEQRINLTTRNPLHAHMLYQIDGQTAMGTDGKTYTNGTVTGSVMFARYGGEVINGFEVLVGPGSALYGNSTNGVIQTITKSDLDNFSFELQTETSELAMILGSVLVDGVQVDPQVTPFGTGNVTTNLNGSGWANTAAQVQGIVPQLGYTWLEVDQPPLSLLTGNGIKGIADLNRFNYDGVGPHQLSAPGEAVFSLYDRPTTIGGPAWGMTSWGVLENQVGTAYDFADGFHADRLTDITGVGSTVDYYVGPIGQMNKPWSDQLKLSVSYQPAPTNGPLSYTAGARAYDGLGNFSDWELKTSFGNKWNISAQVSLPQDIGFDRAALGIVDQVGDLATSGAPRNVIINTSSIPSNWNWELSATNVVAGVSSGFLGGRGRLDGVFGFGYGPSFDQYQVMTSTGSGSTGQASVNIKSIIDQIRVNLGYGTTPRQGLYNIDLYPTDNASQPIGDRALPRSRFALVDFLSPLNANIIFGGLVTPGLTASGTLTGTDNFMIAEAWLGIRTALANGLFAGGLAYVPIAQIPVPGHWRDGPRVTNLSMPITGVVPVGFRFFNPVTGVIDFGNFHRTNGGMIQLMDAARNLSTPVFVPFANTEAIPTLDNVLQVFSSVSTTDWCPGTCIGGGNSQPSLEFRYRDSRPTGDPMFMKAAWYGIPHSGGGIVYPLGTTYDWTETPDGGGRIITFDLAPKLKKYCGPSGPMSVFSIGWERTGDQWVKPDAFTIVTVRTPDPFSNICLDPA